MKKVRFIVLTLVVAMMLMGAGYAAWTDKLTIEEIIVETGVLDVDFVPMGDDDVLVQASMYVNAIADIVDFKGYEPEFQLDEIDGSNKDKVAIAITNLYPGAEVTATMKIKNLGTIPVKLDKLILEKQPGSDPVLLQYIDVTGAALGKSFSFTNQGGIFTAAQLGLDSYEIAAGAEETIVVKFNMNTAAPNESTEDKAVKYVAHPFFKQFNM